MRPTYLAVFLAVLGTGMGLPVPEDAAVLASGALGGAELAWAPLFATCLAAVLLGDLFLYGVGRTLGAAVVSSRLLRRVFPEERVKRGEALFARHGDLAVVLARFVMGVRAVVFVAAGTLRRPLGRVLLVDLAAALVHVPLLMFLGSVSGSALARWTSTLEHGRAITGLLVVLAASIAFSAPKIVGALRQRRSAK